MDTFKARGRVKLNDNNKNPQVKYIKGKSTKLKMVLHVAVLPRDV